MLESVTVDAALEAGLPWPLGAHWDGDGINFAVFSAHASGIDLCLFDESGRHELSRMPLPSHTNDVWHGYLPGARPGVVYGLRARGSWRPDRGYRFNPNKLLLDPYAREVVGNADGVREHLGHDPLHPLHMDGIDNAPTAPKARVVHDGYDWRGDRHPRIPAARTVLYELHVKGFSKLRSELPPELRGTYAGLAHPSSIAHFKRLGVTSLSLLPVQQHANERHLLRRGLSNYWGYNTLGFFAVEPDYASGHGGRNARDEFRDMVRTLHSHGLEVLIDVVFNHTCEESESGPTLSWRGLDNISWYRLVRDACSHYENHTGCGNTLNIQHPRVMQFVMDSLRYWVQEMHVDGFRFDLAPVLGRGDHGFDPHAALFKTISQDPVLCGVKLVAEPWDIGPGGYQLGNFPRGWFEWNDRFRDGMRAWWLRGEGTRGEFALRLCASSDIFHHRHRWPSESVNFVTAHDGFTLRDVVSYNDRHNGANGENGEDGHPHNLSWNCGVEGDTSRADVLALRGRIQRALLATTLLAQGTPMISAGSELGHTQRGNNNAYCQDNEISWIDWAKADEQLIEFTARLITLRRERQPLADHWYTGLADARGVHDLAWFTPDGHPLEGDAWNRPHDRCLGVLIGKPGGRSNSVPLLLLVNAGNAQHAFALPAPPVAGRWSMLLDTDQPTGVPASRESVGAELQISPRSLVLLELSPTAAPSTA